MSMNSDYEKLLRILDKEIKGYEELVMILSRKQEAIIEGDVDSLRQLVAEEQSLVRKIEGIVKERNRIGMSLSNGKGEKAGVRLSFIIEGAPESYRERLHEIRYKLMSNLEQISRLNRENEYLLNFSIDFVRNMAQLIIEADGENIKVYNARGYTFSPGGSNKMLDYQI